MTGLTLVCAWCTVMVVLLRDDGRWDAVSRLSAVGRRRGAPEPSRIGVAALIAAVCASVRGGGTIVAAFEEQAGRRFAVPRVTADRLRVVLAARALPGETAVQIERAAAELAAACAVSDTLGCPAVRCLEAVGASWRRTRLLEDLRAQAFAVPQATVLLLSALPGGTVLLGELLGAHPVAFLLGSGQGLLCLAMGCCCYVAGLAWMRAMMRGLM